MFGPKMQKMKKCGLHLTLLASLFINLGALEQVNAQNLLEEKIWKVPDKKKSVYLEQGIFHFNGARLKATLGSVRHSFGENQGYERVVFDFNGAKVPSVYGHVSKTEDKIYIDFFETAINSSLSSFGNSKYVKNLNFYPISPDSLSVEVQLKQKASVDIFTLENPGRLVIDIKE